MSDPTDPRERWRRLRALESIRLASENLPPAGADGIFPEPGSGWNLMVIEHPVTGEDSNWYLTDLARAMLNEKDVHLFDEGIHEIRRIQEEEIAVRQTSQWKATLSLTLFLPLMLILGLLRFPARPGSLYTVGQAVLGLGATLALVGFVIGLLQTNWLLVGLSVYWWTGAKVIESEARARGYVV